MMTLRKRILEDSDDDDHSSDGAGEKKEEGQYKPFASAAKGGQASHYDEDDDATASATPSETYDEDVIMNDEETKPEKKSVTAARTSFSSTKKQKTLTGTKSESTTTKKGTTIKTSSSTSTGTKSEAAAKGMKSNAALLKLIHPSSSQNNAKKNNSATITTTTPYSALCDTFSAIEEISSRLEIQEKLTELFRMVLLQEGGGDGDEEENEKSITENNNKVDNKNQSKISTAKQSDLYTLLYLASNSVAPQHDNVELGVGDSILIKAIGEASGTNPQMIKKKYDTDGDLGTVAQTSKGKQKTLMFGKMAGPKPLNCIDVLTVFREIANVSGSQSQKWKVDKIKSLLVRARGSESKYIIRGLQGKLRIGLAQTTVLASLAHAVVLTKPRGVVSLGEDRLKEIRALDGKEGEIFI
jgi:DNA ligase-1